MRKFFTFLAVMFVLAVSGCTPAEEEVQPLTVSETAVVLSAEEDEVYVTVTAPGEWTATSSDEEWCYVSQSGNTLSIYAPKNYQTQEREAVVTVMSGDEEVEILVIQEAGEGYNAFTVTSDMYDLESMGTANVVLTRFYAKIPVSVTIEDENCEWSVEVIEGKDFISVPYILFSDSDRKFDITVKENIKTEAREGKVKIWSEYEDVECAYILSIRQVAGTGELQAFQVASTKYTDIPKTGGYSLTMPYRESKIPLIVASTVETYKWTAEVVEGKDFVTIPELIDVEGQESFDILLAENNTTANRTAKVKIWCQYEEWEQVYEITLNQQLSQYTALQVFPKEDELKVMSFNIWVNRSGEHAWNNRKAACYELINYHRPALIGIQEAMCQWHWRDLVPALRKYGYEGYGLSPYEYVDALISTRGGTSGVFYDKSLFEKLNYGTFWISDTPDVPGSKSWGSGDIRIGTWLILKHKHTGKKICYINTHLDFGDTVQVNSMTLIMQKFEELGKDCDYWISTGDYNMYSYSKGMKPIEGKLKNTRLAAPAGKTDNDRTYNAADPTRPSDPVDHVLCSQDMEVVEYHTIDDSYGVPYVSDHYPVYAIVKL